jgi:integrase
MARRQSNRLTPLSVTRLRKPGMHPDGNGLYLRIKDGGARSWIFRYKINNGPRYMGLGVAGDPPAGVDLMEARRLADIARADKRAGLDPIAARDARKAEAAATAAKHVPFKECAASFHAAHKPSWRNSKHAKQWESTMEAYVYPLLGDVPVGLVDTTLVMNALEPHWTSKTETMSRVRGRIEKVLDWAKTRGYRSGENPARWQGHMKNLLPSRNRRRRIKHHPSMPYADVPAFVVKLPPIGDATACCLEFTILTACRTSETTRARWPEVDLDAGVWVIPADRIKGGKEHRVPLCPRAVAILKQMQGLHKEWVFPGQKHDTHLSDGAMLLLLDRMGHGNVTVHGFRSSFRNWAGEQTSFPSELAEVALAHVNDDETEAAYLRTDYFDKRRKLMEAWGSYATNPRKSGNVVPMNMARQDRQ